MCLNENSLECIEMDESGDIFLNPKYGKKLTLWTMSYDL